MKASIANRVAILIGVLACAQMAGAISGVRPLRGLGAAWGFSPCPKVFADVEGLEPFASEFTVGWLGADGGRMTMELTPEAYARLRGPYVRRNVYGAALSYAPRLPEALWKEVFGYGLGRGGPLREELGIPADARDLTVRIRTKTRDRRDEWVLRLEDPR